MVLATFCSESTELATVLSSTWEACASVDDVDGQRACIVALNRCLIHLLPTLVRQEELDANAAALERAAA